MRSLLACFSPLTVTSVPTKVTAPLRVGMFDVWNTVLVGGPEDKRTEVGGGRTDAIEMLRSSSISIPLRLPLLSSTRSLSTPNVVCWITVSPSTFYYCLNDDDAPQKRYANHRRIQH